MDFRNDEMHEELLAVYKDFAENAVAPIAAELDEQERFPEELLPTMAEMGLMGIPFPEEYGGTGMDELSYVQCVEEISKKCASTGVTLSAHTSLGAWPIYHFGTDEQKAKYLPDLCSGKKLGAFGLTEPGAGTDAAGQKTVAEDKGDYYLMNGSKMFITNAAYADIFIVMAMTDKSQGTKGISAFIIEKGMPGFSIGKKEHKMGIRGSNTCELIFEDVKVPKENLLGKLGKGFALAMQTLDGGRIGIAAQALGIAEGALDVTIEYVKQRQQFGKPIAAFQNTQFELAQMKANTEAAKLLVYRAANCVDNGLPYSVEAAEAKLVASRNASDVTRRCLQLYGGYGYTREYPIERMMRDAKITEIYEGTSEVQMMVIGGSLVR
ncbi:MAG: acyl-CoA dehydrogenase [Firmicutes bacterium]|nr:acyl-CoA dehydrogenase [Bacillota bacterium]MBR5925773.1 acyl-CoA dehydrogenase [Bacillota bacterium]